MEPTATFSCCCCCWLRQRTRGNQQLGGEGSHTQKKRRKQPRLRKEKLLLRPLSDPHAGRHRVGLTAPMIGPLLWQPEASRVFVRIDCRQCNEVSEGCLRSGLKGFTAASPRQLRGRRQREVPPAVPRLCNRSSNDLMETSPKTQQRRRIAFATSPASLRPLTSGPIPAGAEIPPAQGRDETGKQPQS